MLFPTSFPGVKTSRDYLVKHIDRARLEERLHRYFDGSIAHDEIRREFPSAMEATSGFDAQRTRELLIKKGFDPQRIMPFCYRPFDHRWIYWETEGKLLDRPRPEYAQHILADNVWIEARQKQPQEGFDRGYVVRALADNFGNGLSSFFPLFLDQSENLLTDGGPQPNLSTEALDYLRAVNASHEDLFFHAVSILHSPAYRAQNQGALRQGWPRVPLPNEVSVLKASAKLGLQIAGYLDVDYEIKGVTAPPLSKEFRSIGVIQRNDNMPINPDQGDLDVTAGWGHAGKGGATMPGRGKTIERPYTEEEKSFGDAAALLGEGCFDVYLNEHVCWKCIPSKVWTYTICGYDVIKKWLSYRERGLLGRGLTVEEARYVTEMARRIAALILLQPKLDGNYQAAMSNSFTRRTAS